MTTDSKINVVVGLIPHLILWFGIHNLNQMQI
jgi:hypothetical protein